MPDTSSNEAGHGVLALRSIYGFSGGYNGILQSLVQPDLSFIDATRQPETLRMVYSSGNTAVIDYFSRQDGKQVFLQGHCNAISTLVVSDDRKWICTADSGEEPMTIIWSADTGVPIRTFFGIHANGIAGSTCISLSRDNQLLISCGAAAPLNDGHGSQIELLVVEWAKPMAPPLLQLTLHTSLPQISVDYIGHELGEQSWILSISKRCVHFSRLSNASTSQDTFEEQHTRDADLTLARFLSASHAIVATECGDIQSWKLKKNANWEKEKTLQRVHAARINCIYVLSSLDLFVTGADDGNIRVFNHNFQLIRFFEKLNAGGITNVSPAVMDAGNGQNSRFPSLLASTTRGEILHVDSQEFASTKDANFLFKVPSSTIVTSASHPVETVLILGTEGGEIIFWNYNTHSTEMELHVGTTPAHLTIIAHSPVNSYLIVFDVNGIATLYPISKVDGSIEIGAATSTVEVAHDGATVTRSQVCSSGGFIACTDTMFRTTILNFEIDKDSSRINCLCAIRANYAEVVGLWFPHKEYFGDLSHTYLYTLSRDRRLLLYTLDTLGFVGDAKVQKIEQTAIPTAVAVDHERNLIYVCTDQWHLKTYSADAFICKETCILPAFLQQQVNFIESFSVPNARATLSQHPSEEKLDAPAHLRAKDSRKVSVTDQKASRASKPINMLVLATEGRLVSILQQPYRGNPYCSSGLIAHHGKITAVHVSHNSKSIITVGGELNDKSVRIWNFHSNVMMEQSAIHSDADPDAKVRELVQRLSQVGIASGQDSNQFESSAKHLFYYAQIREQGENFQGSRALNDKVPLTQLPHLLRVLGHFPSDAEMDSIIKQVSLQLLESGRGPSITLSEWLELAWNVQNSCQATREEVCEVLDYIRKEFPGIDPEMFLQTYGEPLTREEINSLEVNRILKEIESNDSGGQ